MKGNSSLNDSAQPSTDHVHPRQRERHRDTRIPHQARRDPAVSQRIGTTPPEVEALNLVAAGESLLALPLGDSRGLTRAVFRLGWAVWRSDDPEDEGQAAEYLAEFRQRIRGKKKLGPARDAEKWMDGLLLARGGDHRTARIRLKAVRRRFLRRRDTKKALAVTIDLARNYKVRFPGSVAETRLDECVEHLARDDRLRRDVERLALICASDSHGAWQQLTDFRDALALDVPDLLIDRQPTSADAPGSRPE